MAPIDAAGDKSFIVIAQRAFPQERVFPQWRGAEFTRRLN
jgi:hypothetical protein